MILFPRCREAFARFLPLPRDFSTKLISAWIHLVDIIPRVRNFLGIAHNRCTSNVTLFLELLHFLAWQLPATRTSTAGVYVTPAPTAGPSVYYANINININSLYIYACTRARHGGSYCFSRFACSARKPFAAIASPHNRFRVSAPVMDDFGRGTSGK